MDLLSVSRFAARRWNDVNMLVDRGAYDTRTTCFRSVPRPGRPGRAGRRARPVKRPGARYLSAGLTRNLTCIGDRYRSKTTRKKISSLGH